MRKFTLTIFPIIILALALTANGCTLKPKYKALSSGTQKVTDSTQAEKCLSLSSGESIQVFLLDPIPVTDEELAELHRILPSYSILGECYDVTPHEYAGEDFRIFSEDNNRDAFLFYDNEIVKICSGFGSSGLTSMALADVDQNGTEELYYSYNSGAGLHGSVVGWFDFGTQKAVTTGEMSFTDSFAVGLDSDNNVVICTAESGLSSFDSEEDSISSLEKKLATVSFSNEKIELQYCEEE